MEATIQLQVNTILNKVQHSAARWQPDAAGMETLDSGAGFVDDERRHALADIIGRSRTAVNKAPVIAGDLPYQRRWRLCSSGRIFRRSD